MTPNILKYGQAITIPEEQFDYDDEVIKKRQRYIKRCKDTAWNRRNKEYLHSLKRKAQYGIQPKPCGYSNWRCCMDQERGQAQG